MKQQATRARVNMWQGLANNEGDVEANFAQKELDIQTQLIDKEKTLDGLAKEQLKTELDILRAQKEQVVEAAREAD
jgi:hypothetical protein